MIEICKHENGFRRQLKNVNENFMYFPNNVKFQSSMDVFKSIVTKAVETLPCFRLIKSIKIYIRQISMELHPTVGIFYIGSRSVQGLDVFMETRK